MAAFDPVCPACHERHHPLTSCVLPQPPRFLTTPSSDRVDAAEASAIETYHRQRRRTP